MKRRRLPNARVTWMSPREWRDGNVAGRWGGTDFDRGAGFVYVRLLGVEVSITW